MPNEETNLQNETPKDTTPESVTTPMSEATAPSENAPADSPETPPRTVKHITKLEELDDDVPTSKQEVQQESEVPTGESDGNPFLAVPIGLTPEPTAINVDRLDIRIRKAITEDENAAGARPWRNDYEFPADMPLGRAMEIISRRTVPLRFDADSKVRFRYEQYVPMGLESEPRSTVSCTVAPKMDGSENVLPSKLETMSLFLGDERIDKYTQNLADILKGRREIIAHEVEMHGDALGEEIRLRREEMLELARMNTFLGNGNDDDLMPSTTMSDTVERKERKGRWKKAFDEGIMVLYMGKAEREARVRKVHALSDYTRVWIPVRILADLLRMEDLWSVRRLIRRVEKRLGKKLLFANPTDFPLENCSEKKMTEKGLKAIFDRPKGFITLGGMFEVIAYAMSVRG